MDLREEESKFFEILAKIQELSYSEVLALAKSLRGDVGDGYGDDDEDEDAD